MHDECVEASAPAVTVPPIRVAVIDQHPLVVAGVSTLLVSHPDRIELVDPRDGTEVDVVLYGVDDETVIGHDARLHALLRDSSAAVLAYGWQQECPPALLAEACGTHGFVHKQLTADQLVAVIEQVHRTRRCEKDSTVPDPRRCYPEVEKAALSRREMEVLAMIAGGRTNLEISDELRLSINTVKIYVRGAYRKIDADRRSQAVLWATRHGLGPWIVDTVHRGTLVDGDEA